MVLSHSHRAFEITRRAASSPHYHSLYTSICRTSHLVLKYSAWINYTMQDLFNFSIVLSCFSLRLTFHLLHLGIKNKQKNCKQTKTPKQRKGIETFLQKLNIKYSPNDNTFQIKSHCWLQ